MSELLAGAQIALPSEAITVLTILRIGSQIMYGCFMASICVNTVLVFLSPLVIRTRWWSLVLSILAALAAIVVSLATIIATVITFAAKIALTAQDQLNIKAYVGTKMFAFMWIATVCTDVAFLLHAAMGCCCKPEPRGVVDSSGTPVREKRHTVTMPAFMRRRTGGQMSPQ